MTKDWSSNLHLKQGELKALGYSTKSSPISRHRALNKAIKIYGLISVIRKINILANLNINKPIFKIYKSDLKYLEGKKQ